MWNCPVRWLTVEEVAHIHWVDSGEKHILKDVFGYWYHTDESLADIYGPFETKQAAKNSLHEYGLSL
jgi:elongation factor P hydroxylase